MTLVTNHVVSDTGHTTDHNAIATQVNQNTSDIAANKGLPVAATGATQPTRYVGRWSTVGAPASGTFAVGDFGFDSANTVQICTVAGTPGTFVPSAVSGILNDKGNWVTATVYAVGDVVTNSNQRYSANTAHTASALFTTDAAKWTSLDPGPLAQLSNAAPQNPGTAAAGSAATSSRGDHVHASLGLLSFFWGPGVDGAMVFDGVNTFSGIAKSGNVYTLNRSIYATNLTINVGVTVITNEGLVNVAGTATINGVLQNDGNNGGNPTGGAGSSNSANILNSRLNGGNGATGAGGAGSGLSNYVYWANGGAGGAGGTGAAGAASSGGQTINSGAFWYWSEMRSFKVAFGGAFNGAFVNAAAGQRLVLGASGGGGGGGGDGTNAGGGGGSGGGVVILNARILAGSGSVTAKGGNGANGSAGNSGGGGGGGGGIVLVNTVDQSGWTGTITVTGGTQGTGVGTGAAGTAGSAGYSQLLVWA